MMMQDLNNMKGRIMAAKKAQWQKSLADRWHQFFQDDYMVIGEGPCIICSSP